MLSDYMVECNKELFLPFRAIRGYLTGLNAIRYLTVEGNKVLSDLYLNAIRRFLTLEGNKVLSDRLEDIKGLTDCN